MTGSTTTISGGTEQQQPQSQSVEIEIDNIQATPLQERAVPFPFETDSWSSGSCPSDRSVNYHYGTLNLTFEPACQFAEGIQPIVLILAGFIAMFIIMGVQRMLTKILLPLGKFFEGNIGAIITKALSFIGVGVLTYGALTTAFNAALSFTQSHYNGLAPDILSLVGLGGFGEAAGIIVGAMAGKIAMQSIKKLGLLPS